MDGTITAVTGSVRASSRNAVRAGSVICLAGVALLLTGLVTALVWLSTFGISFLAVGLGMALAGAAFLRTNAGETGSGSIPATSSEQPPRDENEGHPANDTSRDGRGWIHRAIGKTDTSRLLDHEIEQHKKSRRRRQEPSGLDGGRGVNGRDV